MGQIPDELDKAFYDLEMLLRKSNGIERAREIIERTKKFNEDLNGVFKYYNIRPFLDFHPQILEAKCPRVVFEYDNGETECSIDMVLRTFIFHIYCDKEVYVGVIGEGEARYKDGSSEDVSGIEFRAYNIKSMRPKQYAHRNKLE